MGRKKRKTKKEGGWRRAFAFQERKRQEREERERQQEADAKQENLQAICEGLLLLAVVAPILAGCVGMVYDAQRGELGSGLYASLAVAGVSVLVGAVVFKYGMSKPWLNFGFPSCCWSMVLPFITLPIALGVGAWAGNPTEQWWTWMLIATGWGLSPWGVCIGIVACLAGWGAVLLMLGIDPSDDKNDEQDQGGGRWQI